MASGAVARLEIPDGDAGTVITLQHIARLIRESLALPIVRAHAVRIIDGYDAHDWGGQMAAIRAWLVAVTRFVRDPAGMELVMAPDYQLERIAEEGVSWGDCDDVATLAGAIAGTLGFQVALVTVAFLDKRAPLSHIWTSISPPVVFRNSDGKQVWVEMDTTRPMQEIPMHAISRSHITLVL